MTRLNLAEAKAKRAATLNSRRRAVRAWEQANPGPHNLDVFRRQILPKLAQVTGPQMMRANGPQLCVLPSRSRGDVVPHPMHWGALASLVTAE